MELNQDETGYALYIGALLFKMADHGELTEKEREDLRKWRESDPRRQAIFDAAGDRTALAAELRQLNAQYDADEAAKEIFLALGLEGTEPAQRPGRTRPMRWLGAAAVLAAAVAGIWLFRKREDMRPAVAVETVAMVKDIPAAHGSAILTLADGRRIDLDSVREGHVTRQAGADVVYHNGQLSYQEKDATAAIVSNTVSTGVGGQYNLALPDGTRIWLNAESSVTFPSAFTGNMRTVDITGEAYFEVKSLKAKDGPGKIPFITRLHPAAGETAEIRVLGTHFDAMAYPGEAALETTLIEGSVVFRKGDDSVLLKPGQQGRWSGNRHMQLVADADTESVLAWKNGLQAFRKADIPTIMRHVQRWYNIAVHYQGTPHDGTTFSGEVPIGVPLSQLLKIFETPDVHFRIDGEGRSVTVSYGSQ